MNEFTGILELQVESLLTALSDEQTRRCREIVAAAEHQARQLREEARRTQRARLRQAVQDERQRRQHALLEAASRIETREQRAAHTRYERILRAAWPELRGALERRWEQSEGRKHWCEMVIRTAARVLSPAIWSVEHPAEWLADDAALVTEMCNRQGVPAPVFVRDPGLRAGLRVRLDEACLDGSIDGLLSDRREIDATILATWEEHRPAGSDDGC